MVEAALTVQPMPAMAQMLPTRSLVVEQVEPGAAAERLLRAQSVELAAMEAPVMRVAPLAFRPLPSTIYLTVIG